MTQISKGSCLCGQVSFEVSGDFESFFLCHCKHCQKGTGSAHVANLFSSNANLNWVSGKEATTTFQMPETRHSRTFCNHCGSPLPTQSESMLMVPAGSLDTDVNIRPNAHIFMKSKANWDVNLESVPKYDKYMI